MRRIAAVAAVLSGGVATFMALASPALAQGAGPAPIPVRRSVESDPLVRSGTLPNGMRYHVRQAALPAHGLSMRIGFDVGSYDEADNERGFAHFVEHLAFRRSRSNPDGGADARFARLGVAFGRDQNAQTTEFNTTYRLDFNTADPAGMAEGVRWLRDVADGVLFVGDVIRSEHGVIIAEQSSNADEKWRINQAIAQFQAPELRSTWRRPNGLPADFAKVDTKALKGFYERWYRPERAIVVLVGDRPAAELEAMVRNNFASWQGQGTAPVRVPYKPVNEKRGLDVLTLTEPGFPKVASACRVQNPPTAKGDEMAQQVREYRRAVWQAILNSRIERLVHEGKSGLLGGTMLGNETDELSTSCLLVMPMGEDWRKSLEATQRELLRFGKDGPTEAELETEVESIRSRLRGAIDNVNAQTSPALAGSILDRALDRRVITSPAEAMHAFDVAVEDLTPAMLKAAFNQDWAGAGPLLALALPSKAEPQALREAWLATDKSAPLPAYTDLAASHWAYADFGKAGVVTGKEKVAKLDFTRIRFANGVVLNFKQLKGEPNRLDLRAKFGNGRKQLANRDVIAAAFGTALFEEGGLGKMPATDIERALSNSGWRFDFAMGNDSFEFFESTLSSNLQTSLQVFAAFFSDPAFRNDADARLPEAVEMTMRGIATDPAATLGRAMSLAIDPDDPAQLPEDPKVLMKLSSADFARVLKAPITTDAIEVTIAGDVDEATATRLVGQTLGALPARQPVDRKRADAHFLRFPDRNFPVIRATHEGASDRAAASLIWPLYVAEPARRREEYALQLVAALFDKGLRDRIRAELGKSYSPEVTTQMPDFADQGLLEAEFLSDPADVDRLIAETRDVAAKLAAGVITAEEVEGVRQPKLSQFTAYKDKNIWWSAAMSGSAREPDRVDELVDYEKLMSTISLDEVKAAAAKWLSRPPIVGISLPKGYSTAATPATTKGRTK